MNFRNINYFLGESITNISRNSLMSFATITTTTISILILGSFLLIIINVNNIANSLARRVEIVVFLKDEVNEVQADVLRGHIQSIEGVTTIEYVSKEKALERLQSSLGEKIDLRSVEKANPLPASLEVKVVETEIIEKIAQEMESFPEVAEVQYGQKILPQLLAISQAAKVIGLVVLILLGLATILLTMNTIRLTIFARRKEIKIMQLVGATEWFIRWPFILEGIFQGLIGASLAVLVLSLSYYYGIPYFQKIISFVPLLNDKLLLVNLSLILITLGGFLGVLGSLFALSRILEE